MTRFLSASAALVVMTLPLLAADDPIRDRLDKAKAQFQADIEALRKGVFKALAARQKGDKPLVDQIKAERVAFEENNTLPKAVSTVAYTQGAKQAEARLTAAYKAAITEYLKGKRDTEATEIEEEMKALKAGPAAGVAKADPLVGRFECNSGVAGNSELWDVRTNKKGDWEVNVIYLDRARQPVGAAHGKDFKSEKGSLAFVLVYDKAPASWGKQCQVVLSIKNDRFVCDWENNSIKGTNTGTRKKD